MNIQTAMATLGAALILAGAPGLASAADTQAGPIQITSIQPYGFGSSNDAVVDDPMTVQIDFTNQNSAPATEVDFALFSGGVQVAEYQDLGSFAKGVEIKHTFPSETTGNLSATVVKATFADGTTWQNPSVPEVQGSPIVGIVQAENN